MTLLAELGTVVFDREYMSSLIGMGRIVEDRDGGLRIDPSQDPTMLQFGLWIATVPEAFRPLAELKAREVGKRWMMRAVSEHHVRQIVAELAEECVRAIRDHRQLDGAPPLGAGPDRLKEYLALVRPSQDARRREQRAKEAAELTANLQNLAPEELLDQFESRVLSHDDLLADVLRKEMVRLMRAARFQEAWRDRSALRDILGDDYDKPKGDEREGP
jgi:hypothetical protein